MVALDISINYLESSSKKDFLVFLFSKNCSLVDKHPTSKVVTTVEGATLIIHTKPILEGPSLGRQQVLQLPCPGSAGATSCDALTGTWFYF